jgi:hypothetical protein
MPSFWDWLRALWLFFLTSLWLVLGWKIIQSTALLSFLLDNLYILTLGMIFVAIILPITCSTYMHYIFWGKHDSKLPAWLASWPSWHEGLWEWFIASTATVIVVLLLFICTMVILFPIYGVRGGNVDPDRVQAIMEPVGNVLMPIALGLWLLIAAKMQRWKRLWAKKAKAKAEAKTEAKAKANAEITAKQKQALKHIVTLTTEEEMELLKQQLNKKPPKSGGQ